jgi:hypothetical protein
MQRLRTPVRLGLAILTLVAATVAIGGNANAGARPDRTFEVTITNITEAQYLTPPNWAAHSPQADVFDLRGKASPGVQGVAENGNVPGLAAELAAAVDGQGLGVSGVGTGGVDGPIGPGESRTFEFSTPRGRFSLVSMVVCTNDGFVGLDSRGLPMGLGESKTFRGRAYDAGTEVNTELRADLVPAPFCGEGEGSGMSNPDLAENGVITFHKTLRGVGDIDPALDWRGPVATIEVTRVG